MWASVRASSHLKDRAGNDSVMINKEFLVATAVPVCGVVVVALGLNNPYLVDSPDVVEGHVRTVLNADNIRVLDRAYRMECLGLIRTQFEATMPNGQPVSGAVCRWPFSDNVHVSVSAAWPKAEGSIPQLLHP